MIFSKDHPYQFLKSFIEREFNITHITASYYFYRQQSLVDERVTYLVDRETFLDEHEFSKFIDQCPVDFEVAIHSDVLTSDSVRLHFPMIDMSTSATAQLNKLENYIGSEIFNQLAFYDSGRSFHVYGQKLLSEKEWIAFMGTLLLSNQKDLKPLVDPRWIGHRLIAGYSSLRWTKNTSQYLSFPKRANP
ncbi:hypothetical protein H8K38_11925 [Undibacterium sp. FT79W]|uniref:primase 1D-like protein n=1 Tax=Undibacterium sp. FT79W TaxID=2762296 RepID=UPI00164C6D9E|nr:hypothetical protein [Undibacterium sp. FT79W]MBC3878521.1 hypothetical protein [Undibacterium sp. FT79W]